MIQYTKQVLNNGLTVIMHEDHNTPLVSVNVLYAVGARDEDPNRTGFAHLFEHLMFGGTRTVPNYDYYVNSVGGESNAFTNNDYTNYYLTVPAAYLETALWLEADRMRLLDFSQKSLEVQQNVVTEEYNQRFENQPYGDVWLLLRPLCYTTHPYRWSTIGSTIEHVQQATLDDVEQFFFRYYCPDNAILSVAGNIDAAETLRMVEKHFGNIQRTSSQTSLLTNPLSPKAIFRQYPQEPPQQQMRRLEVHRPVPSNALYMAFPMCHRLNPDYYVFDLLSDVLSNGKSSRLYNELVKKQALFTDINAYISGDTDPGIFVVSGKLHDNVSPAAAETAITAELCRLVDEPVPSLELQKVINKMETSFLFSQYKALDRAMALCYYEWLGHLDWVNNEPEQYRSVQVDDLQRVAKESFTPQHCSVLEYLKM